MKLIALLKISRVREAALLGGTAVLLLRIASPILPSADTFLTRRPSCPGSPRNPAEEAFPVVWFCSCLFIWRGTAIPLRRFCEMLSLICHGFVTQIVGHSANPTS